METLPLSSTEQLRLLVNESDISDVQKLNRTKALELFGNILGRTEILETQCPGGGILRSTVFLPDGYEEISNIPKAMPIIHFSPGGSKNQVSLWEVAKALSDQGICVITSDPRGKGFSTGNLRGATVDDFSDDVLAILNQHLKDNALILAGHSLGGAVIKRAITKIIEQDIPLNVKGLINHASSELDATYEFISHLPTLGTSLLPALIHGVSDPIPAFVGDNPPKQYTQQELDDLEKAMASQESLGITSGMSDPTYPNPNATERFLQQNEGDFAVVMINAKVDQIFPYEDEHLRLLGGLIKIRRPGTQSRELAYRTIGLPVFLLKEDVNTHSAISLYKDRVWPVLKKAYEMIRDFDPSTYEG